MKGFLVFAALFGATVAAEMLFGWIGLVITLGVGGIIALGILRGTSHASGSVSGSSSG